MRKLFLMLCGFTISGGLFAGGYQLNLLGQRQIGMGHVGTALSPDASSIVFNPGALALMDRKFDITVGGSFVSTSVFYKPTGYSDYRANTNNPLGTPFSLYAAFKATDKIAFGVGVYTPFGSSVVWGDNWKGRYLIQDISLRSIFIQPTVSYKITDKLGIGAGFVAANGQVEINKALPFQSQNSSAEAQANLKGSTWGYGYNVGAYYKPTDKLSIGIDYRSRVNMNVKNGDVAMTNVPTTLATLFPAKNTFSASLPLPSTLTLGFAYNVNDKLTLATDINYVHWKVYDSLIFDFGTNTSKLEDSRNARLYKNAYIFRLGGEYKVSDKLTGRAGVYYDMSPVQSNYLNPETPDVDKIGLSAGLSFSPTKSLTIDASFLYIKGLERTAKYEPANFSGTYRVNAIIPGVGLRYHF